MPCIPFIHSLSCMVVSILYSLRGSYRHDYTEMAAHAAVERGRTIQRHLEPLVFGHSVSMLPMVEGLYVTSCLNPWNYGVVVQVRVWNAPVTPCSRTLNVVEILHTHRWGGSAGTTYVLDPGSTKGKGI